MNKETGNLLEYVKLLKELSNSGFVCNREINEALNALHSSFGFDKKSNVAFTSNGNMSLSGKWATTSGNFKSKTFDPKNYTTAIGYEKTNK
ncbi:hypothetical protein [Bacillus atrophaeus]|uniref:hypothetical protein n=1 Tax=Bacillus atrophaeus TaxID=1452 RepID=UPI000778F32C|nr:hypothetical protein [Bacillus atrophaeus]KYD05297.1 hypothetical protein B4144_1904 [Bacillus atrophaeus]